MAASKRIAGGEGGFSRLHPPDLRQGEGAFSGRTWVRS